MKKIIIVCFCLSSVFLLSCQNVIEPNSDDNVIMWSKKDSPIVLDTVFHVPEGKTLVIEPGVDVLLRGGNIYSYDHSHSESNTEWMYQYDIRNNPEVGCIKVHGTLSAMGTKREPITFSSYINGLWGSISADSLSTITMSYCHLEKYYGVIGIETYINPSYFSLGAVIGDYSNVEIDHCIFTHDDIGISMRNSNLNFTSNLMIGCGIGVTFSNCVVQNNIIINDICGLKMGGGCTALIVNNNFLNMYEAIGSSSKSNNFSIYNNVFYNLQYTYLSYSGGEYDFFNNIVHYEHVDYESEMFDGNNWIGVDPLFIDEDSLDFTLDLNSTAINNGTVNIEGYEFTEFDYYQNNRISGSSVDIGACESLEP